MNDRLKFRVWDIEECTYLKCKYSKSAGYHKYTFGKHDVWHDIGYFIENNPKYYVIEQCTGLKDKNGKLIYENDVLLCERKIVDGATGTEISYKTSGVVQRDKNGMYFINGKDWYGSDITFYNEYAEIIGNIHEQAEQKE